MDDTIDSIQHSMRAALAHNQFCHLQGLDKSIQRLNHVMRKQAWFYTLRHSKIHQRWETQSYQMKRFLKVRSLPSSGERRAQDIDRTRHISVTPAG